MATVNKLSIFFFVIFAVSCTSLNQLANTDQVRIGMTIEDVCNVTVFQTSINEDPCIGSSRYFKDSNALILFNSNLSTYLVFGNVTNIDFRGSGGTFSKLLLITSSIEEAEFYIHNLLDNI